MKELNKETLIEEETKPNLDGTIPMETMTAVLIAEGVIEPESDDQFKEAWQHLIDTKLCWQLQGWFGRTAERLIEEKICKPFPREETDESGRNADNGRHAINHRRHSEPSWD